METIPKSNISVAIWQMKRKKEAIDYNSAFLREEVPAGIQKVLFFLKCTNYKY